MAGLKSRGHISWLDHSDQQFWFDRYKSADVDGLPFTQFQEFLKVTLYAYFSTFPKQNALSASIQYNDSTSNRSGSKQSMNEDHEFNRQQEMRLFKVFDTKNDHVLDRDEFASMCSKWLHALYEPTCGLVIVDVQNDFIDGSLALINGPAGQDGAEVVPVINDLIECCQQTKGSQATIVYTQDWHPADHIGFHANLHMRKHTLKQDTVLANNSNMNKDSGENDQQTHNCDTVGGKGDNDVNNSFKYKKLLSKARVFDTVLFEEGRLEQKLWPTHCVQNSWGAQLHPKLRQLPGAIHIQKGTLSHVDAYSAFWDNMRLNETGLGQELLNKQVSDLFFCGLALDFCVAASALDAAKAGFVTYVIEDACRGIDEHEIEARKRELLDNGVFLVQSCHVRDYLMVHQNDVILTNGNGTSTLDRDFIKTVALRKALL